MQKPFLSTLMSIFIVVLTGFFGTPDAVAAGFTSDDLAGDWTLESKDNCGKPEFEHITFSKDGTISARRFGRTTLTGFWEVNGDLLTAHIVTSPAHVDRQLHHMNGQFDYFLVDMIIVNANENSATVVGRIGKIMRRMDLARCKQ